MPRDPWVPENSSVDRRISIKLASGRNVWVMRFGFSGTYNGVIEGLPDARLNAQIVASESKRAKIRKWDVVLTLAPSTRTDDRGTPYLPPVSCVAELESLPMNNAR